MAARIICFVLVVASIAAGGMMGCTTAYVEKHVCGLSSFELGPDPNCKPREPAYIQGRAETK